MAEEPSPACCRQVRRRGARQRPPVDGSWFVDLLWSLPSTAAHLRRPEPLSRLAEGHPKGLALTRARTAPSSGCRGQGSRCAPAIEGFSLSRKAFSSSIGLRHVAVRVFAGFLPQPHQLCALILTQHGATAIALARLAGTPSSPTCGGIAGCSVLEGVAGGRICGVRDTELYRHLLGLVGPWEVDRVELSVEGGRVDV